MVLDFSKRSGEKESVRFHSELETIRNLEWKSCQTNLQVSMLAPAMKPEASKLIRMNLPWWRRTINSLAHSLAQQVLICRKTRFWTTKNTYESRTVLERIWKRKKMISFVSSVWKLSKFLNEIMLFVVLTCYRSWRSSNYRRPLELDWPAEVAALVRLGRRADSKEKERDGLD